MKNHVRTGMAIVGMLVGGAAAQAAAPDMAAWSHRVPVELTHQPSKGLVEVELTPEALAIARPDLGDLRLTGGGGVLVPFIVRVDRGSGGRAIEYAPVRTFNAVFVPGKQSSVTVDFGNRETRTSIDVVTPGRNFRRKVQVEASADGATWEVLRKSDWLFRIDYEKGAYGKSSVELPANDFQYLRVTVFNAPDDPERVAIERVTAWRSQFKPPETTEVTPASVKVTENSELKATEIEVDLGLENMPVFELAPTIGAGNFVRRVELLVRNVRTRTVVEPVENSQPRTRIVEEPWASVATGGSIYRLPGGEGQGPSEHTTMGGVWQKDRYFLLRIYNGDDAPLKIAGVRVWRYKTYLAFATEAAGPYHLYLGNAEAPALHFDLDNYAERLRAEGVTVAKLGTVAANPLYAAPVKVVPWSERHAVILWSTLGVVLAVLTGLVLRQARHAAGPGAQSPGKQA